MSKAAVACLPLVALCLVLLSGCAINPKITDSSVVYVDNWTRRNNPDVYVQPMHSPAVPVSALIVPFEVTQDIAAGPELGEQVTRILWQTWTRDRVFPRLLYETNLRGASAARAMAAARRLGIDVVVVGKITYIMSGGTRGDSGVSLTFDIFDVRSGERLWSMAHAGTIEAGLTEDYIIFRRKNRMPTDPIYAVTSTLAMDMGGMLIKWNYGAKVPPPARPNPPSARPNPLSAPTAPVGRPLS